MKKITLKIDDKLSGKKIKYLLANHLNMSASLIKKLKNHENGILLNSKKVFVIEVVSAGDVLELNIIDDNSENIPPVEMKLDILYEDDDIIAINKPASVPTHPSLNHHCDTLANGVMYYFKDTDFTFRVITRLDKDTSGVVLIAKNQYSAQILGRDMKNHLIKKHYVAAINGTLLPEKGIINVPIARKDGSAILRCVSASGKEAISEYTVVYSLNGISYVSLIPHTGRTHQLRVHMSYMSTPIFGDDMYGAPQLNERTRLHCESVTFAHPISKKELVIKAPVPNDIIDLFK